MKKMIDDKNDITLSAISRLRPHLEKHLRALADTRSFVISFERLSTECKSLEEAVVAEIVAQLLDEDALDCIPIVRALGLSLKKLCKGLLSEHDALILVLDDVPNLMTMMEYSAWFKSDDFFFFFYFCQGGVYVFFCRREGRSQGRVMGPNPEGSSSTTQLRSLSRTSREGCLRSRRVIRL